MARSMFEPSGASSGHSSKSSELTVKKESKALVPFIEKWQGLAGENELIIAIVRDGTVADLTKRLSDIKPKSPLFSCLFGSRNDVAANVVVTTESLLQQQIAQQEHSGYSSLRLVASGEVEYLAFNVRASRVDQLHLHRCGSESNAHNNLIIEGASTFHNTRLDEWQRKARHRQLWLDPGVVINPDLNRPTWGTIRQRCDSSLGGPEKEMLRRHVNAMEATEMKGEGWWRQWRGSLSAILGILGGCVGGAAGYAYAGIATCAKTGAYVNFAWGSASFNAAAVASAATKASAAAGFAAGGAILLGVGVAATVYFVPWDTMFEELKGWLPWLWNKLKALWNKLKQWLATNLSSVKDGFHGRDNAHWKPPSI